MSSDLEFHLVFLHFGAVQSSCTRSDTEAESKYMKNMQETKQQTSKSCILLDTKMTLDGDEHDMVSMKHAVAETEGMKLVFRLSCFI